MASLHQDADVLEKLRRQQTAGVDDNGAIAQTEALVRVFEYNLAGFSSTTWDSSRTRIRRFDSAAVRRSRFPGWMRLKVLPRSGNAMPVSGDLIESSDAIAIGARDLKIEIRDIVR